MDAPSGGAPEQAPRWDLVDTEGCGGGIRFLAPVLIVWGYVGIHRRGYSVDVEALHGGRTIRRSSGIDPKMGSRGYRRLRRWNSVFGSCSDRLGIRRYI